jgi:catechol 2,3-dioxygenase-like lactoylglutathione lyase family enzyme
MSEQMAGTDVRPGAWTLALSHSTLECKEIEPTRRFYSEFLGLETLRRGDLAIWFRCGGGWMVASVCTSEKQVSLPIESRWCLDMASPAEVNEAHEEALQLADEYGIQEVLPVTQEGGYRAFSLRDLDGNWWEIGHRPGRLYDHIFGNA